MFGFTCCCAQFAILVYNSNAAVDDDFMVFLNGNTLDTINNNSSSITGRIFALTADITPANIGDPSINDFEATSVFDPSYLINGVNTLRIESIVNNHNNNAGLVRVGYYALDEVTVGKYDLHGAALFNGSYAFDSGVGMSQSFTFTYP